MSWEIIDNIDLIAYCWEGQWGYVFGVDCWREGQDGNLPLQG